MSFLLSFFYNSFCAQVPVLLPGFFTLFKRQYVDASKRQVGFRVHSTRKTEHISKNILIIYMSDDVLCWMDSIEPGFDFSETLRHARIQRLISRVVLH